MFATLEEVPEQIYRPAHVITDEQSLTAARRLHAEVYLGCGYFAADDLTADGVADARVDPFVGQSTYFATRNDPRDPTSPGAVSRLIHPTALSDLSIPGLNGIDPYAQGQLARIPLDRVAEVSALARARGASSAHVVGVYSAIYRHAVARGVVAMVATIDHRVHRLIAMLIGDSMQVVGPTQMYMGSPSIPSIIWVGEMHPAVVGMARTNPRPMAQAKPLIFPATSLPGRGAW